MGSPGGSAIILSLGNSNPSRYWVSIFPLVLPPELTSQIIYMHMCLFFFFPGYTFKGIQAKKNNSS